MVNAIATKLKSLLGSDTQIIELSQANAYWQHQINQALVKDETPIYVVFPQTIDELSKLVQQASQEQWRILICGNGSKLNWGKIAQNIQIVVSTQKCNRLIEHAVGDLTVTVEAGMKLADLQTQLRSHNQFLPIDPTYSETATLGGITSTADAGSWQQRYGGVRDLLLGLSFVRADGQIAKAGGRVVKNVAGYDLMKLFTGSYGTLGVISQLTFRTFPLISASQTLLLLGKPNQIAVATETIRNSGLTPTAMDLLSTSVINQLGLGLNLGLLIRWQTIVQSINQQIAEVQAIANRLNITSTNYQQQVEAELWHKCATITSLSDSDTKVTCKIGIAPNQAINLLQLNQVLGGDVAIRVHAGSGIGRLQLKQPDSQIINKIRDYCQGNHGFLTVLDAPPSIKQQLDVWGYTGNALETMKAIKNQFDPQHIFNPDRFLV